MANKTAKSGMYPNVEKLKTFVVALRFYLFIQKYYKNTNQTYRNPEYYKIWWCLFVECIPWQFSSVLYNNNDICLLYIYHIVYVQFHMCYIDPKGNSPFYVYLTNNVLWVEEWLSLYKPHHWIFDFFFPLWGSIKYICCHRICHFAQVDENESSLNVH